MRHTIVQDEEVQQHIVAAMSGAIAVGSYRRPLAPSSVGERGGVNWTELGSGASSTDLCRRSQPVSLSSPPRARARARGQSVCVV